MRFKQRDVVLSLEYRLWHILKEYGWTRSIQNLPLTPLNERGVPANTYAAIGGLPWVFLNGQGNGTKESLVVYVDGSIVDNTEYTVDWINSRITFGSVPVGQVKVDVDYFTVRINQGYADTKELTLKDIPLISYIDESVTEEYYAVGTHAMWNKPYFELDLITRTRSQRQDLTDDILYGMRYLPLFRYSDEQVLGDNGDINPDCDRSELYVTRMHKHMGKPPAVDQIPPRSGAPEVLDHRAIISFELSEPR